MHTWGCSKTALVLFATLDLKDYPRYFGDGPDRVGFVTAPHAWG